MNKVKVIDFFAFVLTFAAVRNIPEGFWWDILAAVILSMFGIWNYFLGMTSKA